MGEDQERRGMQTHNRIRFTILMLCATLAGCCIKDKINVDLVVPGEVGILFDGADTQSSFNDRSVIVTANTTTTTALLPNIQAPAFGNSLVVFSRSRQPRLVPAPWTKNADTFDVQLQNNIRFDVTFWI